MWVNGLYKTITREKNAQILRSLFSSRVTFAKRAHFELCSLNALDCTHPTFTCSKLFIETLEQGVKYGQS